MSSQQSDAIQRRSRKTRILPFSRYRKIWGACPPSDTILVMYVIVLAFPEQVLVTFNINLEFIMDVQSSLLFGAYMSSL